MPFHISGSSAAALVAFAAVSVLIGSALAGAGGWRALAVRFPAPSTSPADEERYRFTSVRTASGIIGMATYGSCVTVGVSDRGISLALWAPFRLFHPALLVPWDAVEECRAVAVYGQHWTNVSVRAAGSVTMYGRAAVAIARAAERRGLTVRPL
jgi:hypothetical protein